MRAQHVRICVPLSNDKEFMVPIAHIHSNQLAFGRKFFPQRNLSKSPKSSLWLWASGCEFVFVFTIHAITLPANIPQLIETRTFMRAYCVVETLAALKIARIFNGLNFPCFTIYTKYIIIHVVSVRCEPNIIWNCIFCNLLFRHFFPWRSYQFRYDAGIYTSHAEPLWLTGQFENFPTAIIILFIFIIITIVGVADAAGVMFTGIYIWHISIKCWH